MAELMESESVVMLVQQMVPASGGTMALQSVLT